ncbi:MULTISPECIES: DUF6188 family protein [Streptomyces]|uniref:DUF6188 family protein n=1 Tax=Streptomyces TaxID=1883 RepID=UPI00167B7FE4|nr:MULTISPECIES: DUF6188 family protein [Streptomyces]MBD3580522.1 hypothetical protein [Streptomyces sp. KD18]GGT30339.1 hypothetical protein GCM10010286_64360 [Streptomyces toxytricini]
MIEEHDDRWVIGLLGTAVVAVDLPQGGLTVALADGTVLTVSGPVLLTDGPASAPGAVPLPLGEAHLLIGATVRSAVAFKNGSLRLVFGTGHHLNVRATEPARRIRLWKPRAYCWSWDQGTGTMRA